MILVLAGQLAYAGFIDPPDVTGAAKQRLSSSKRSGWNTLPWKANGEKGWLDVLAAVLGVLLNMSWMHPAASAQNSPTCIQT